MIKTVFAASAALSMTAGAAIAGPYVNIESNAGFTGTDYEGTVTEFHVGVEGDLGEASSFYAQLGPALVSPDGEDRTTELSGKVGVNVAVSESVSVYGEIAAITADEINLDEDLSVGTKLGLKWTF